MTSHTLDTDQLGDALKALAAGNRLQLFLDLRSPRTIADLQMRPDRRDGHLRQERPLTRQSITHHLATLEKAGLVTSYTRIERGRRSRYYQVDDAGVTRLRALFAAFGNIATETTTMHAQDVLTFGSVRAAAT